MDLSNAMENVGDPTVGVDSVYCRLGPFVGVLSQQRRRTKVPSITDAGDPPNGITNTSRPIRRFPVRHESPSVGRSDVFLERLEIQCRAGVGARGRVGPGGVELALPS